MTAAAFTNPLARLAVAALYGHQLGLAGIGTAALARFRLVLCLLRPGDMGLGDLSRAFAVRTVR